MGSLLVSCNCDWQIVLNLPTRALARKIPTELVDLISIVMQAQVLVQTSPRRQPLFSVGSPEYWSKPARRRRLKSILDGFFDYSFSPSFAGSAHHASIPNRSTRYATSRPHRTDPPDEGRPDTGVIAFCPTADTAAELARHDPYRRLVLVSFDAGSPAPVDHASLCRRVVEIAGLTQVEFASIHLEGAPTSIHPDDLTLLHIVCAAAVALSIGQHRVTFCENGVRNLNLPVTARALTEPGYRPAHPGVVALLCQLLCEISDSDFTIDNPSIELTPTDVAGTLLHHIGVDKLHTLQTDVLSPHIQHREARIDQHLAVSSALLAHRATERAHQPSLLRLLTTPMNENLATVYIRNIREFVAMADSELMAHLVDTPGRHILSPAHMPLAITLARDHARDVSEVLTSALRVSACELFAGNLSRACLLTQAASPRNGNQAPAQHQAIFRMSGKGWEIHYDGERAIYPRYRGLAQLHLLLQNPYRLFSAIELQYMENPSALPVHHHVDHAIDETALRAYRNRARELQDEIEETERTHDLGRAQRARHELEQILEELSRSVDIRGRPRPIGDRERARRAVSANLHRTLRRIREHLRTLAAHLDASLRIGAELCYAPMEPVDWVTT